MIEQLCKAFDYDLDKVRSYSKPTELAVFRGCLYAFLKYETNLTTTEIGKLMNRKHSTIVNVGNNYYYMIHHRTPEWIAPQRYKKIDYLRKTYERIKTLAISAN